MEFSEPRLAAFREEISAGQSEDLQESLRTLGRLIAAITMPDAAGVDLQEQLRKLANNLRDAWQNAYDAHRRRTDLSPEERSQTRRDVRLRLAAADSLFGSATELIAKAVPYLRELQSDVQIAASYARFKFKHDKDAISSDRAPAYTAVENVWRQIPSALQSSETPMWTHEFNEHFIDDLDTDLLITARPASARHPFASGTPYTI